MSEGEFDWMLRATFYRVLLEPMLLSWLSVSHNDFHLRGIPRSKVRCCATYCDVVVTSGAVRDVRIIRA